MTGRPSPPRLFLDSDVVLAGSASPNKHSASLLLLRMGELGLIENFVSIQVMQEIERNLQSKLPTARPVFQTLAARSLHVVENPAPPELEMHQGRAHQKDLAILVSAFREQCRWLVTFHQRHYQPGLKEVQILSPGQAILRIRAVLSEV